MVGSTRRRGKGDPNQRPSTIPTELEPTGENGMGRGQGTAKDLREPVQRSCASRARIQLSARSGCSRKAAPRPPCIAGDDRWTVSGLNGNWAFGRSCPLCARGSSRVVSTARH
jgi:hypothetical protein